uniref:Sulfotransferase n=1 Tax=Ciona savignyi TaxID=51511 RepID=H2YPH1_CIOSA
YSNLSCTILSDPLSVLQRLERFLNIEPYFNTNNVFFNESKGFYCWLQDGQSKCLGERKGRKHPKVDKQIMDALKLYYKKPNEELFKLIGKKFDW